MMLWLHFGGWFQCRLPTDPDPADEPRGVSGYAQAVAGEPDLDRVIRFQPPGTVWRSHTPKVGVAVRAVALDSAMVPDHPLLGAAVDLLDSPCFEGRNGIVAEDGFEPIVPFVLDIATNGFHVYRPHADRYEFPFTALQATGVQPGTGAVAEATGIYELAAVWQERQRLLKRDLAVSADLVKQAALRKRLTTLSQASLSRFFGARMFYSIRLAGSAHVEVDEWLLPREVDVGQPWVVDFWMGGWDADAFQGYVKGSVGIPLVATTTRDPAIMVPPLDPLGPLRA